MLVRTVSGGDNMFFTKKKYLNWSEYSNRILQIEGIRFMNATAKQSINNYWQKEAKNGLVR
jgi:hypothetical protein